MMGLTQRVHGMPKELKPDGTDHHGVFRAIQRRDGLVSMDADNRGGELTTPVLQFAGDRLNLNAACHGLGEVWVEIQDPEGRPLPGFGMDGGRDPTCRRSPDARCACAFGFGQRNSTPSGLPGR